MFASEQMKQLETKVQQTIAEAQKLAAARARQVEGEARKAFELLGDRAQSEMKQFLAHAQTSTREQWLKFGGELVKLGQKMQEMAHQHEAAAANVEADKAAAAGVQQPPDVDVH